MAVEFSDAHDRNNTILQHVLDDLLKDQTEWEVSQMGSEPLSSGSELTATISRKKQLNTPDEIANDFRGVKTLSVDFEVTIRSGIVVITFPDTEAEMEELRRKEKAERKAERKEQKQIERETYQQNK